VKADWGPDSSCLEYREVVRWVAQRKGVNGKCDKERKDGRGIGIGVGTKRGGAVREKESPVTLGGRQRSKEEVEMNKVRQKKRDH